MIAAETESATPRVPFGTVLASAFGLWLCYFVLATLRAQLLDLGYEWEMMWRRALVCAAGVILTLGLWLVLRVFDLRPLWVKIVAALILAVPVSVMLAQVNRVAFADLEEAMIERLAKKQGLQIRRDETGDLFVDVPIAGVEEEEEAAGATVTNPVKVSGSRWSLNIEQLAELAFGRYFMLLAWCALYLALLTGEKARAAERREQEFRNAARAAELRSLRYQVNPHFLFNTLNSLSALVLTGRNQAAEKMIQTISTFYRRSLAEDITADVPLREEFKLQRLYLEIEAVRFPERLEARYELPEELASYHVPSMILQPLVENSIKHAVAPSKGKVTIAISAREEYGRLVVTVADDGLGTKGEQTRPGFGIGLDNVRQRLGARFGKEASVVSGPVQGGYATHLRLPIIRGEQDEG